ncbi:MAG: GtrA family protein [Bacteroidia bacterium]|jgi:putative flippase GtrA|nr:GtrA family protein [Bacteroidales bacterium]MDD3843542.1 GtrA family protein [Bacteroidales bacterium]MDD4617910.1 GtrA family protein [Bacteroidales bacterium]NCC45602.1 GtrA family protein [Bacteroidia bacterium]
MIEKFILFGIVGFSGLLVDFGITWVLKELFRVNKFLANGIGFMMAASSNYLLNRVWTFDSTNPDIAGEYASFIIISLIGLVINTLILYLLTEKANTRAIPLSVKAKFYLSKLIAIGVVTIWNFLMNFFITFS